MNDTKQKFHNGDLVRIAKDLGSSMPHFTADCDAIVLYSYDDRYGLNDYKNYCLYLKDKGESSWYHESQLTLIKSAQYRLLEQWKHAMGR